MKLAIITLTRGDRPEYLAECVRSIRQSQPADSVHLVHTCTADFQRVRYQTTVDHDGQYVAWVDDDDMVVGDALARCVQALDETGLGLAFTREARMDGDGVVTPDFNQPRAKRRRDLAMHPRSVHHLAVVRRSCLAPVLLEQCEAIGVGIDWMMRAYAGLVHGAVQVPMTGYLWRAHAGQESLTHDWEQRYTEAMPKLRSLTNWWMGMLDGPIGTHGDEAV